MEIMAQKNRCYPRFGFISTLLLLACFGVSSAADCVGLSLEVTCTCDDLGHCERGTVEIDPWVQNTLKTQVDVQLDLPFNHVQFLDAHNSYNTRAYGELYGALDTCNWPPPYQPSTCLTIGNQEFSLTDLMNMGIRAVELDNWYCEGEMRIAHLGTTLAQLCNSDHVIFSESVQEIGEWMDQNPGEIIRLYINEKFDQGNDGEINGPFERYLGDRVLTPADLRNTYGGEWPTLRTMLKDGKSIVIAQIATAGSDEFYLHQGKFIHPGFWLDKQRKYFTNYPQCGGKNDTNALRFYSDSTHYLFDNELLDGPSNTGYVESFAEFVKCRIQYPGADMITPQFMETAIYSWAQDEPTTSPTDADSCILLNAVDNRWYTPTNCDQTHYYACRSVTDGADWLLSESAGGYDVDTSACPSGYRFALPQNGYQNQRLLDMLDGTSVWLNVAPLLPDYLPPTAAPPMVPTTAGAANPISMPWLSFLSAIVVAVIVGH